MSGNSSLVTGDQSSSTFSALRLREQSPFFLYVLLPLATLILWRIVSEIRSPLRKYPGPLLARWTRLWYMYCNSTGNAHLILEKLHKKHGPIVRITPEIIDIDEPEIISSVFSTKGDWLKTPFYHGSSALVNGQIVYNLFSENDPKVHAKQRRPIAKFYSPVATTALEPLIDPVIKKFCDHLESRFIDGPGEAREFDLGQWILLYTWDVTGSITFSKPFGYLEKGHDFDGLLEASDKAMDYFVLVGAIPSLDRVLDKNPIYHIGPPGFGAGTAISVQRLQDRFTGADKSYHDPEVPDFLDHFIEAKNADPDNVDDFQIISWLMVNMIAGSDTTAIAMRNAIHYPLQNPRIWKRLNDDILAQNFHDRGAIPPSYKDARAIPYVDAVIREALRFLPGVAMPMERRVPPGGFTLPNGDFLQGGTIIGMNPYITNRNPKIFGEDSEHFRPERWLRDEKNGETEEAFQARLIAMNKCELSFGAGSRICIGKNIGLYQVYKVLVTLISLYEIELSEKAYWKVTNSWFPRQEGLRVRMKRRQY